MKVKDPELPVDQPPAVTFTAFADVWPRATGNVDRRRPMRHWRGKDFDYDFDSNFNEENIVHDIIEINFGYLNEGSNINRDYDRFLRHCHS